MTQQDAVCAVVVNWNGWRDSEVCVTSLLAQEGVPVRVLVVDNGSTNDSARRLQAWISAQGDSRVHLLCTGENRGYAAGLNAGIRHAQRAWGSRRFWLLNNDLSAEPGALAALVRAYGSVPDAAFCGSVLLDWEPPHRVQAVAGCFSRALGIGWHLREWPTDAGEVLFDIAYPVGASLYVEQPTLDRIGLLQEDYFLYYEEMDWAERARRAGLRPMVARGSRLRHKEGASTGSSGGVRHKSLLSEHHGVVNRLRFTRRFWPRWLPVVWASLMLVVAERLVHAEWKRAWLVARLMLRPGTWLWR